MIQIHKIMHDIEKFDQTLASTMSICTQKCILQYVLIP